MAYTRLCSVQSEGSMCCLCIIYTLYKWTTQWGKGVLIKLGKASFETFLAQIILKTINYASIVSQDGMTAFIINFAYSWVLSIIVGLCWCKIKTPIQVNSATRV